ncbi:hypothetical protein GCM10010400_42570 [Streptomyces aculeolatus]|uniref:hypothetical protein n=1 Tax=Streptomyces aculeolatus TaxID=270689 RepID=UPI001CEC51A8|nr:hypothetical protein [Streptomyces aculeolatus]
MGEPPELEVSVSAGSDRFAPDDDRWLSQTRLLHQDLARTAERLALHTRDTSGTKGGGLEHGLRGAGKATAEPAEDLAEEQREDIDPRE